MSKKTKGRGDVVGSRPSDGGDRGAESPGRGSATSHRPHSITFTEPTLTRPSFKAECDVNNIVRRYAQTGMVNHVPRLSPQWGDAPEMDFHEAMRIRAEALSLEEDRALDPEAPEEPSNADPDPAEQKLAEVEKDAESVAQAPESGLDGGA